MPGFDGTGPNGQGSLTGRKMGNCVSVAVGCGIGRGRGLGRGFRGGVDVVRGTQPNTNQGSYESLLARVSELEAELTQIKSHDASSDN